MSLMSFIMRLFGKEKEQELKVVMKPVAALRSFSFTKQDLLDISPTSSTSKLNLDLLANELQTSFINSKLDTVNRRAAFIAQCAVESAYFTTLEENLNYSKDGLLVVFPKYFTAAEAARYARNPQAIASRVYADRMGNGPEQTGDGWKYRGRGLIQLTGKDNYYNCGSDIGTPIVKTPDALLHIPMAVRTAIWFWEVNKLNELADLDDIKGITRIVNGGYNHLAERTKIYQRAKKLLAV